MASLHARTVTFHEHDGLVERILVEPYDRTADVIDVMLAAARAKLDADQAPISDELSGLLAELDHRSRLHRATAAADWLTGSTLP